MFISIFLVGRNSNWSRSTRDFSFSPSYYCNTASDCRWWVYTSSDFVFDKGTTKLSVGAAAACLLKEEIPPLSLKETQQTAKTWNRHPKWNIWAHLMETSCSASKVGVDPRDCPLLPRPCAVKCSAPPPITAARAAVQPREAADSRDRSLSAQPQRIIESLWLCVVCAQTPHDEHLIWVDESSYSQESGSPFILFALLVGCKINEVGRMTK